MLKTYYDRLDGAFQHRLFVLISDPIFASMMQETIRMYEQQELLMQMPDTEDHNALLKFSREQRSVRDKKSVYKELLTLSEQARVQFSSET